MNHEQPNLYDDMERFKATGKTPDELEKNVKDGILKNKITGFIDENKRIIDAIIKEEGKLGALDVNDFVQKFSKEVPDEKKSLLEDLFAEILGEKGYKLSGAVVRVGIEKRNSTDFEKKSREKDEDAREEKRRARAKLPPQQRGIPNGDL